MNPETERLIELIGIAAETMGHELSSKACAAMARELSGYPPAQVIASIRDCMRTVQGRLTLATILQRLQADDGHPSANEAWAIALEATDEYKSVSLTPQIQQALASAQPVLSTGDKVGARMAFLATYERLVTQARQQQQPATWTLSVGFDAAGRLPALEAATAAGRLTYQPEPFLALPPPQTDSATPSGLTAVLALLAEWKKEERQQQQEKWQRYEEEREQRRVEQAKKREEQARMATGLIPDRRKYKNNKMKKQRTHG